MKLPVSEIRTAEPFRSLFPANPDTMRAITEDMRRRGFAEENPIVLWGGHASTVLDGHTRLAAARAAGIVDVPVVALEFPTESAALEYAIRCQRNRRNLTDADIVRCVAELDKRNTKAEAGAMRGQQATPVASSGGKTAEATAEVLGVNRGKVEKARTVLDRATPEVKAAVEAGEMSINRAYNQTVKPPAEPPPAAELHEYDVTLTITRRVQATDAEAARARAIGEVRQLSVREMSEHITTAEVTP